MKSLNEQLNDLPQLSMPEDRFADIQHKLDKRQFLRKHRFISAVSCLGVMVLTLALLTQKNDLQEKDVLIETLMKRTQQLEQLLLAEEPNYSTPGSHITETIVNMENYIAKLDEDIRQSKDKQRISELMATKLDMLGHLVLLQRKINHKPDYQKVKPYII